MKKLLAIAACASAVAAFGTDVALDLGVVGVTAVTSSTTNTIVAVSYKDLADGDGNVTASNLVKTTNLTLGDHLYVYNNGDFIAFELKGETSGVKYWEGVSTVGPTASGIAEVTDAISSDADSARLTVGTGVWLVRGSSWDGAQFTFFIYGKPATETSVSITSGTTKLVGNPTQTDKAPTFTTGPNNGDRILVPFAASKTGMRTYTYVDGTGWRYSFKQTEDDYNFPSIPAGTGFWYVAVATEHASTVEMSWSN